VKQRNACWWVAVVQVVEPHLPLNLGVQWPTTPKQAQGFLGAGFFLIFVAGNLWLWPRKARR
jgi:hypothetical protein